MSLMALTASLALRAQEYRAPIQDCVIGSTFKSGNSTSPGEGGSDSNIARICWQDWRQKLGDAIVEQLSMAPDSGPVWLPISDDIHRNVANLPPTTATTAQKPTSGIQWASFLWQELFYVSVEHGFRVATQTKTRRELGGPFFADWAGVITNTQWNRWGDGDKFITSYGFHPAQGSVSAWIYRQNDTNARDLEQDFHNPAYCRTLAKAFVVAEVAAVLWKIGPISEATIGHVGLYPSVNKYGLATRPGNRSGLDDYVMDAAGGIPLMIGEDWLDKHVARRYERRDPNLVLIEIVRMATSPTRSFANVMAFRAPWYRERRDYSKWFSKKTHRAVGN
jgi:hypothetical protein